MHSEKRTIWLSCDDDRGDMGAIFEWEGQPHFGDIGHSPRHSCPQPIRLGWNLPDGLYGVPTQQKCRERYGFVPAPGTCVPVVVTTTFSPGAVVHAPKEASDE